MSRSRSEKGTAGGSVRRAVVLVLASVLLLGALAGCAPAGPGPNGEKPAPVVYGEALSGGLQVVARVGAASLSVDPTNGEFVVEDGLGGTWRSNPADRADDKKARDIWKTHLNSQLILTYASLDGRITQQVNSFVGSVRKEGLTVYRTEDGFVSEYVFEKEKFTIPLRVSLTDRGLRVAVLADRIDASEAALMLVGIDLVPFFGAAGADAEGYMVVPDGTGALIGLNNGKSATGAYAANVYGDDPATSPEQRFAYPKTASLPVFGLKTQSAGLLAVITRGDAIARIEANVAGGRTSYNFLYAGFTLRETDSFTIFDRTGKARDNPVIDDAPLRFERLEVTYLFLGATDNGYARMAAEYRSLLAAEHEASPVPASGLYLDFYGAVRKTQPVAGIPLQVLVPLSTFRDVEDAVRTLLDRGVETPVVRMVRATDQEARAQAPSSPAPSARLGGAAAYRSLRALVGADNLYLSVEPVRVRSNGWILKTLSTTSHTIMGLPAYLRRYDLATGIRDDADRRYLLSPANAAAALVGYAEKAAARGLADRIAVSSFGTSLHADFGRRTVTREDTRDLVAQALADARAAGAHLMLVGANAYAATACERLTDVPSTNSGYSLFDAEIPFVQMVYSGLAEYAGEPINLSSNPRRAFLKAIESGSRLHYAFIAGDAADLRDTDLSWLYGSDWRAWADEVAADFARWEEVRDATEGSRIIGHEILGADFSRVAFENGTSVLVNCSGVARYDGGLEVPAMDFRIVR